MAEGEVSGLLEENPVRLVGAGGATGVRRCTEHSLAGRTGPRIGWDSERESWEGRGLGGNYMSEVEAESREEDQDDARSRHIIGKVFGNSGYGAARVRGVVPRCMESMGRSRPPCTPSHQPLCARVLLYLRAGW